MGSTYSVISDLYGVEPVRQRPERQGAFGLVVVMLLAGMFLYESVHPVMRLRSEPPPVFVNGRTKLNANVSSDQQNAAQSYWGLAAQYMSEKYSYGQILPSSPPEDFTAAMGGDYATSSVYWQRLRALWNQPEIWVTSYQLNTDWMRSALGSLGKAVKDYLDT